MNQSEIVEAVRAGRAEFRWVEIRDGLDVFADALKIDGVRVTVTAETAQRVADLLGATLTTPALEDEIYARAQVRIPAFPIATGPDASWEQTVWHSNKIDEELAKRGAGAGWLIATVGKSWCLVNALASKPGKACNYAWHSSDAPYAPATGATRVWQPVGLAHNAQHHDYSQTLRLARVRHGELPTHEGELLVTRQPGVPVESDTVPPDTATSDTEPSMPSAKAYCVDVSHHQNPAAISYSEIAKTASVCIVRTSYGVMRDRQTAAHVARARAVGLAIGLYHFFRPSQPWQQQLDVFRGAAKAAGFGAGDICPALDVEADPLPKPGMAVSPYWQPGVKAMLEAFRDEFGNALCYITQREFGMLGRPEWLLTYPLWTAHYTQATKPATPGNKPCVLWQHRVGPYDPSAPGGYFAGGSPQLDQNRILGSLPIVRGAWDDVEVIENQGDGEDDPALHELSAKAIAAQFPLEVAWEEIEKERDALIRESDT